MFGGLIVRADDRQRNYNHEKSLDWFMHVMRRIFTSFCARATFGYSLYSLLFGLIPSSAYVGFHIQVSYYGGHLFGIFGVFGGCFGLRGIDQRAIWRKTPYWVYSSIYGDIFCFFVSFFSIQYIKPSVAAINTTSSVFLLTFLEEVLEIVSYISGGWCGFSPIY